MVVATSQDWLVNKTPRCLNSSPPLEAVSHSQRGQGKPPFSSREPKIIVESWDESARACHTSIWRVVVFFFLESNIVLMIQTCCYVFFYFIIPVFASSQNITGMPPLVWFVQWQCSECFLNVSPRPSTHWVRFQSPVTLNKNKPVWRLN